MRICTKCKRELQDSEFRKDKSKKSGFYPSCNDCHRKKYGISKGYYGNNKTHGMSKDRFYRCWLSARQRCINPNDSAFFRYGKRGIKCLWEKFDEFKNDMHESYIEHCIKFGERNTTIDRIDVNGNYCKANCRWATYEQQGRNKRNTKTYTYKGIQFISCETMNLFGINPDTFRSRISRGFSIEKAIEKEIGKNYSGRNAGNDTALLKEIIGTASI